MHRMLHSAKFWTAVVDVVCSTALYFVGKYYGASLDDLKFLIASYQPILLLVIGAWTVEDAATKRAGPAA